MDLGATEVVFGGFVEALGDGEAGGAALGLATGIGPNASHDGRIIAANRSASLVSRVIPGWLGGEEPDTVGSLGPELEFLLLGCAIVPEPIIVFYPP